MNDVTLHAFVERGLVALERIANALDPTMQPAPQRAPGSCPHCGAPEEKQANAGTLTDPHLKRCLVCQIGYEG